MGRVVVTEAYWRAVDVSVNVAPRVLSQTAEDTLQCYDCRLYLPPITLALDVFLLRITLY